MTLTNEKSDDPVGPGIKKSRKASHYCCSACVIKCEKLCEQVESLTEKLKSAEEENKKLKSMLSADQKLQA
uniref:Uncharacterized protein n=1 Tax=Panagrolaimus sp. PS1159 TaxID=55785 RepID=A0AC35EX63_9BILA